MPDQYTAYVFVDANTALHFKRPDQIDWLRLTKAKEVVLVAAPILLRELENQKVVNTSRKLRERANAYVKWLHKFAVDPKTEVRTSVRWLFLAHEPQIDFVAERLSTNIHDDHLIASALGHMREGHTHVFVATADLGLTVKLRARGISVLTLSDDLRLPIEADPLEQENSALKQQLARLHARMPKLSVAFDNGEQHIALKRVRLKADGIPSLAQVRSEHMFMTRPGQPRASGSVPFPLADLENLTSQFGVSGDRIDTYNRDLERFTD